MLKEFVRLLDLFSLLADSIAHWYDTNATIRNSVEAVQKRGALSSGGQASFSDGWKELAVATIWSK